MSTTENKALIERFYDTIWHGGHLERFDEFVAPGVAHLADHPEQGDYRSTITTFRQDYPDIHWTTRHLVGEDDVVVHHWTGHFTRAGQPVALHGITLFRLADGKIIERWPYSESLGE